MKALKGLSVYTLTGFLGAGINFLIMPLLSHYLSPEEYGILSIFNTYVIILIPLIGLVASSLVDVDYYKMKNQPEFASLFSSVQFIPIIPALSFIVLLLVFGERISAFIELAGIGEQWLLLLPVMALLTIYVETFFNFLIVKNASIHYATANILKIVTEITLTLLFVVYMDMGWEGRLLSWLITSVIYVIVFLIYFSRQHLLTLNIKWLYIRQGILFGAPLILHVIGKFVINQSDRLFIAKYISLEETGIYNIGYQIGMILLIVVNAFGNFFTPFLYERLAHPDEEKKLEIVRLSYLGIGALLLALVGITAASPILFDYFIDPRYRMGQKYVFWTGLSYLFWGVYIVFSGYIFFLKRTGILALISVVNVVLNLTLNFILIRHFGAIGVAYATCISFFVIALWTMYYASRCISMPWFEFEKLISSSKRK
jgi:O-antigen/teichoic acid export membrane protein